MVLIYLVAPGEMETTSYAIAGPVANLEGRFTAGFVFPSEPRWENQELATVIARDADSGASAQALFKIVSSTDQPTETPGEPTATTNPTPTAEGNPIATPQPGKPMVTANTNLNIRGGPGTAYPVLGFLLAGQTAEVTGISADAAWWQIKFSGAADGHGWLSAKYVTAQNTSNVPVVQAPPLPATPTPTPTPTSTPVVISDWRGEYYNNPNLSGAPVLIRNDVSINFDWGAGSPGPGVPADNFSARWSRDLHFPAGNYRFYVRVDDGVRLWVDGNLVVDQWRDSAPTTYSADVNLTDGAHSLRMEYYERGGGALAQLTWERWDNYPDWKAEYYNNPKLEGNPVLVRNETEIDYNWGTGSPAAGVPADNFSARWTREVDFKSETYVFSVWVDDGVRLWIDDALLIDSWRDGKSRLIQAERQISSGEHWVKVDYYEHSGAAQIEVTWQRKDQPTNQAPQAVPGGPYTVNEGGLVTFDGSKSKDPDGSIVKYEWDFDYDGRVFTVDATGQTASTSYPDGPATVTIALQVTDDKGASQIATTQVTVVNMAPTAEAGGPYVGQVGSLISMAGTAVDPGFVDQTGLSYRWDFGDGTQSSGPMVSHSYQQAGSYTVTLTVTDKDGAQGTDTATVQVHAANQPPAAIISGPTSGLVGETLSFDGNGSSDSGGRIVSYAWDLGDGTTGGGITVTHRYSAAGSYQVTLTVTDDGGLSDSATQNVQVDEPVTNLPPIAIISGPTSGLVEETLSFSGSGSSDSDGRIVSYVWDFGDGSTGGEVNVTHSYSAAGSYQVTLTVTDDGGLSDSSTQTVQVAEPVTNLPPTAVLSGPTSGLVEETLSFSGVDSADPDGRIVSYAWDFGDGTTTANPASSGVEVTHSYSAAGSYQVTLTVTDDGGLSDSATQTIQVAEPSPGASNLAPTPGQPPLQHWVEGH